MKKKKAHSLCHCHYLFSALFCYWCVFSMQMFIKYNLERKVEKKSSFCSQFCFVIGNRYSGGKIEVLSFTNFVGEEEKEREGGGGRRWIWPPSPRPVSYTLSFNPYLCVGFCVCVCVCVCAFLHACMHVCASASVLVCMLACVCVF